MTDGFEERLRRAFSAVRRPPYAEAALFAASAGLCLALTTGLIR
ncbi:hypothetical protein GCM10011390_28840 [Aureimonas endophytica]|uniref:Uncharacterized protein n=1 Tax=Aureimonas endophytica TaxID=2027858 RepID=A0A917E7G2_9HYPH|nr:hypothetical protein [Aureimonas endophytica]GGE08013.1 hypothetical protein GCM10011390_28840 [Aureimonas endophytica]